MSWHVTAIAGPNDPFPVLGGPVVRVPFDCPDADAPHVSVAAVLARHALTLEPLSADLLRLAVTAHCADTRIPRRDERNGFDSWTRDIAVYLFVSDPQRWAPAVAPFERLLRFLTGDDWHLAIRAAPAGYVPVLPARPRHPMPTDGDAVALLSGGLDSFVGAVDLLAGGRSPVFVGHHAAGGVATSLSQERVGRVLRTAFGETKVPFLGFGVTPPTHGTAAAETTTRGRSLLFLTLAILSAQSLGVDEVVVPENGFISLNVPLSSSRLGSLSTRTTHPYTLALFREVLAALEVDISVRLPYRFVTKGEMVSRCQDVSVLWAGLPKTMSCSHPEALRFSARRLDKHCGRCLPCIVRRAGVDAAGGGDPTDYEQEDLSVRLGGDRGSDLRVLRMGLHGFHLEPPTLLDVLSAGPLPGSDDEKSELLAVFRRGLEEIRAFLALYPES